MYGNNNPSDEDKNRQRNTLNMQLSMLDSDQKKFANEKNMLEAEIRKTKMDIERLEVDLGEKKKRFDKITFQFSQNEEEIKRIKRKLASL
jgi:chromosome segregation ATPase